MVKMTLVTVGICTYRRAVVVETLRSLAAQKLPADVTMRIVVADNDVEPEAAERVSRAATELALDVTYVHAPSRNICLARNACLDAASGEWFAFLDDDETASPTWLAALLTQIQTSGCDAVLGPVRAVYSDVAPGWIRAADLHSTRPVISAGCIEKGYAGNVILRRQTIAALALRFDPALGRSGGEDDDFFYRLTDGGGSIGFASDAIAYEPVPSERTTLRWLLRRSFRTGQTHGVRLGAKHRGSSRPLQMLLAGGKGILCFAAAGGAIISEARRNRWLVRGALHMGVVARLVGLKELQLY
jgi:succinoglycan biosynthesis protein ExoM